MSIVSPDFDVYCFGHVSVGKVYRIRGRYPEANGYAEVVETLDNYCGEATGAALVLRRLGLSVTLEGNWLGDNEAGRCTLQVLGERGIDVAGLRIRPGYQGVNEVVISDGETRTVFGRYVDLLTTTKQWEDPTPGRITRARIACIDPTFGESTLQAARLAAEAGIPVVSSDAREDSELTRRAAAMVVSLELLDKDYPGHDLAELFERYRRACPGLVVFTFGSRPLWYGRPGQARQELQPFSVAAVDTAGAGDAFRAGVVYGLLRGWGDLPTLRFASALAALVCTTAPGVVNSPTLPEVEAFLNGNPGTQYLFPPKK
jgi:sugar/nucleoside kinase (ribokinase family)